MENKKIRIGITHGDINGIGYEIILKTFTDPEMLELCTPIVYGSAKVATYHRKALNMSNIVFTSITEAKDADDNKLNIVNCIDDEIKVELSKPTEEAGAAAFCALEKAVTDYKDGLIDAIVTAPINKHTIQNPDFNFPGHTEYIEDRLGEGNESLMILMNENIKVALVTGHIPVSAIPSQITKERLERKITIFNKSLKEDFGITKPRIAVFSLNPHASDNGLIGSEEQDTIIPAINELNNKGIYCFGPYPADGFMGARLYKTFDGIMAMYHDQGLIPFKTLAMNNGVNYTAGLPVIRTSPDHGTAYDIAGKGVASEESFRNAIYTAIDIYRYREQERTLHANVLTKQYYEKRDDSDKLKLNLQDEE